MPFRWIAESRVMEGIERGEFDNLPGAGKPLNLDDYFSAPEAMRAAFSILKNANGVPAEVELLQEVSRLNQALVATSDLTKGREIRRSLARRRLQLAILLERRSSGER